MLCILRALTPEKMASLVLRRVNRLSPFLLQRWASAAAVTVPLSDPVPYLGQEKAPITRKSPEEVRVSHLSNGITVASLENYSHHSNVSVLVRAGSRYETYNQRGLTHLLRNCAFLASGGKSAFGIAREMDAIGSSLTATTTREHLIYSSEFLRGNLGLVVDTLGTVISAPLFQPWEVKDKRSSLELDIATYETQPNSVLFEYLHSAAFRNALCNPLYCPTYNLSKLTSEDLKSYVEEWFTGRRITIVGVGVNHSELVQNAEASFSGIPEGMSTTDSPSEYVGGAEVRIPSGSSLCYAAVVCKGASLANPKDILAAGILQHVLGATPTYVKWGSNVATARLGKAAAGAIDAPFLVTALNMNYSDNGLFGVYAVSDGNITGKLLKAVMKEFSEVAKGSVTDADLSRAKNQLKASYLMNCETQTCLAEDLGVQATLKGSYTTLEETLKQVDSVSKDDVVKFARAVFGTRATFVALGNLSSTPRLDHLLADLSLR